MTHHSEPAEAVARALREHFGTSITTMFTAREAGRQAASVALRHLSASPAPAAGGLEAVLAAYEAETRALPLGAASREKGDSAYNWRMSVVKDLRKLAARLASSAATRGIRCAYCGDTGTITDRVDGEITCPECGYAPAPGEPR